MKKKNSVMRIIFGVLLLLSIIGNVLLFNEINKAKVILAELNNRIIKNKNELTSAQASLTDIMADIEAETSKKEDLSTKLLSIPKEIIISGYELLPSGLTMADVALAVEQMEDMLKDTGASAEKIAETIRQMCEELGTTPEAVESWVLTQEAEAATPTPSPSPNGGSSSGGSSGGSSSGGSVDNDDLGQGDAPSGPWAGMDGSDSVSTSQPNPFGSN